MSILRNRAAVGLSLAVAATGLYALPAAANPTGTGLVISEVYGAGGNSGATLSNDYIELYNPTDAAVNVGGMSVQYRSASGTTVGASNITALTNSIPAHGHYLVQEAAGTTVTDKPLPTAHVAGSIPLPRTSGQVLLVNGTAASTVGAGNLAGNPSLVDMVGYGGAGSYETAPTGTALTATTAATRTAAGADTDNNAADFAVAAPDPQNTGGGTQPPPPPTERSIAEIQGTDATSSPDVGNTDITRGVVTAAYPTGGFNGFYIQTPGTGGATDATPGASDALFVFGSAAAQKVTAGDYVEVTGKVSEFNGMTEMTAATAAAVTELTEAHDPVTAWSAAYPTTEAGREAHEGELLAPTDDFTVTNNYTTNQYAEIGLATGDTPLVAPTEQVDAQDTAGIAQATAGNAARAVTLDDGASTNFFSAANKDIPLPWLSPTNPVRVGSRVTLHRPVILDYRNDTWKFQPTQQVIGEGADVATFQNTRTAAPEPVGGTLHLATFNVLNYFNTTGVDYQAAGHTCSFYDDRAGNHDTVNDCGPTGPRGAAEADDLDRQQSKIVAAINGLGADVVSLEEIENSVALGETDRDDALKTLVKALNDNAGETRWAYAPSPDAADLPPTAEQDVIRTAFIYDPSTVSLVGASKVLVGSTAFSNAREPLAQAFKPKGTPDSRAFAVVVNHFKSKGSGVDDGTGQGNANPDRIAQAHAVIPFADDFAASRGTDKVILTGDYNSYSQEDPMQVLYEAGYTAINSDTANEYTYNFGGMEGSLDHVLANPAALKMVTGADVWNINSVESVAFEYSRYNYNATDFYAPNMYRASDHDPEIVGLAVDTSPAAAVVSVSSPGPIKCKKGTAPVGVTVSADGVTPTGQVELVVDGRTVDRAALSDGRAMLTVGPFASTGSKTFEVRYLGDDQVAPGSATGSVEVVKGNPK